MLFSLTMKASVIETRCLEDSKPLQAVKSTSLTPAKSRALCIKKLCLGPPIFDVFSPFSASKGPFGRRFEARALARASRYDLLLPGESMK